MKRTAIALLTLTLGLAAGASARQATEAPKGSKPYTTTSCIRREMDGIAMDVRLLTKIRDTGKPAGFVPISAKNIQVSLMLLDKCQMPTIDGTRVLASISRTLREAALALKQDPADLSNVDALRSGVLEYERLFHDEFRPKSSLAP